MGLFNKKTKSSKNKVTCPECGSAHLGLGYVDRVSCTVLHSCDHCGARWRDDLIDLAQAELAARTR